MLERLMGALIRGHCRLTVSSAVVSATRVDPARKSVSNHAERHLPDVPDAELAALAEPIAEALSSANGGRLPVHATLGDDVVRYFMVTPPDNGAGLRDLRAAAAMRFQQLYGQSVSSWQVLADWQVDAPFLACAVPQRLPAALRSAIKTQRAHLVSVRPNFVAAWNDSCRELSADAWLATLCDGALTLGLITGAVRPRLAAVRRLMLPEGALPIAWLREQLARAALLDNVPAPSVLHVHSPRLEAWEPSSQPECENDLIIRWRSTGYFESRDEGRATSVTGEAAWSEAAQ